ncbi:MAG: response regulator [Polyangiales bacterium]
MTEPTARALVLVVDDDEDSSALLGICLEREGFEVAIASTLAQARAALAERSIDVALVDIHLADGDGTTLFGDGRPASVRVALVMSGSRSDATHTRAQGFDGFVGKPIDRVTLVALIRALLANPTLRSERAEQ